MVNMTLYNIGLIATNYMEKLLCIVKKVTSGVDRVLGTRYE